MEIGKPSPFRFEATNDGAQFDRDGGDAIRPDDSKTHIEGGKTTDDQVFRAYAHTGNTRDM